MADDADIVVIATKAKDSPGLVYRNAPHGVGDVYSGGGGVQGNTNTPTQHEAAINAHWSNPNNKAEVLDAAQNVAAAVVKIEEYLDAHPNATFTWDGTSFSAQALRSELDNTKFVVTDVAQYDNGGVGSAAKGQNGGPNIDTLSAHSFSTSNSQGYGDPRYNGQAVEAMILHEMGHMTEAGFAETANNMRIDRLDHGTSAVYNNSEYWHNNENFAHDFEGAAAAALGIDVSLYDRYQSSGYGAWQPANEIYNMHHGIS